MNTTVIKSNREGGGGVNAQSTTTDISGRERQGERGGRERERES